MDDFQTIKAILREGNIAGLNYFVPNENICKRLKNALLQYAERNASPRDILPLFRQFLLRLSGLTQEIEHLLLDKKIFNLNENDLQDYALRINAQNESLIDIIADDYKPDWLGGHDIFYHSFKESHLSEIYNNFSEERVPADPCVTKVTGYEHYMSQGQAMAVRSLFQLEGGSEVIINLATGAGKSLIIQLPSLLSNAQGNISIVVVPTTALAIDQEEIYRDLLMKNNINVYDQRFAYYSGLSEYEKIDVKARIREGTQRILFTSPESLLSSLIYAIYDAAKANYLKYFFIDEVHIVQQWGMSFRSEFQILPGLLRDLKRECPGLITVMLTATMTDECYTTLNKLFKDDGEIPLLSAVRLRGEPTYWKFAATSLEEKREKLLEVVHIAPRPIIIFTTVIQDAEDIFEHLKKNGVKRVRKFHGKTNDIEREEILDLWKNDEIDIVVATSAFGLGVNKSNVRTVIHACIPETVDRFYQEVGRGGRDGKSCTSIMIYYSNPLDRKDDLKIANSLISPKQITKELGHPRWRFLVPANLGNHGDKIKINLNSKPPKGKFISERNRMWNKRTLTLMSRAGMIKFDFHHPPRLNRNNPEFQNLSEDEFHKKEEGLFQEYHDSVFITINHMDHLNPDYWEQTFNPYREEEISRTNENFRLLGDLLNNRNDYRDIFTKLYTISHNENTISPGSVCGGCDVCRCEEIRTYPSTLMYPHPDHRVKSLASTSEINFFRYDNLSGLLRDRRFFSFLRYILVKFNTWVICCSNVVRAIQGIEELHLTTSKNFLVVKNIEDESIYDYLIEPGIPRISIIENQDQFNKAIGHQFLPNPIILHPSDMMDPHNPGSLFTDRHLSEKIEDKLRLFV